MMCSSGDPHYHTCCEEHDHDHGPPECRNVSCYCYPPPARYRGGNGWQEGGKKKKKLGGIWDEDEVEEREKLKNFWLGLGDPQRQSLLRIEKESILREMREQQRHICSCSVCGRRRTVLEEELELLYDAYYSELEDRGDSGEIDIEMIDYQSDEVDLSLSLKAVDGGVLTVADDLLVDDGRKFFSLMEKLADGRAQNGYDQMGAPEQYQDGGGEYDEESYQEEEEDEELLEEQRIEEGRRMFQMFAAKMFEQRVLAAYREKVALEKQEQLMQEEEEEEKLQAERKENKARKERERKQKKKELKRQQELEKERKRLEKEEEEKAAREKELREREEKRREKQRQKEDEKRKKEEEEKRKREEEGRRKSLERARMEKAKEAPKTAKGEEKESQNGKKKAKKERAASESVAGPQELEAEGWEIAQGKHKKKAASQEQPKPVPEPVTNVVTDEALAALRTSGAAKHYEQNGPLQSAPMIIPPFQQTYNGPPTSDSAPHSNQQPAPTSFISPMRKPAADARSVTHQPALSNGNHRTLEGERDIGVHFIAQDTVRPGGMKGAWPGQESREQLKPPGIHPQTANYHPTTTHAPVSQQASYGADNGLVLGPLSINVDQELSSSMEHLLPGGLLSATGDTPRGAAGPSGFEEGFAQLHLRASSGPQQFHDANGHFRQPSGSESPESLGSPDSTWSFGRRPGSGSNSSGHLSRPPSGEIGRPWVYTNGAEEHMRKAARQDVRVSWDGSQGMLPVFEMVRSASHSGLPVPGGSSPPMNGHHLPPPAWHADMAFEARLERAISILRSAVPRHDASGTLVQPLSLSAFWQSLLAIDGSLLNERITRAQIQGIWMELASQRLVRIGNADSARPNEPFILAMLLPGVNVNKLGVCLLCNEQPASVQLRPCSHLTCVACTSQLAAQADFGELCCPFCAQIVHGSAALGPDGHVLPSEHPPNEHPRPRSAHKSPQMKAQGGVNGHKEATRIDQEWPTLEAAVTRKMEARPELTVASVQTRPPSSNGEASRKAGWGAASKAGSSTTPVKVAPAHGPESAAWPPLDTATKARRKVAPFGR